MSRPTLGELENEIADVKEVVKEHGTDIKALKDWKTSEDAYRAAVAQVKKDEDANSSSALRNEELKRRTEMIKQAGIVLGLVAAILYAYATTHGIHP